MGIFSKLLRLEPPRPTARELAEANEFRMTNAKEAAARERQRLIVEWLRDINSDYTATADVVARDLANRIEANEPLRAPRREEHPRDPRSRR